MKWSLLGFVVMATGCMNAPARPTSVTAFVAPSPAACRLISQSQSIVLTVRNLGPGKLRIRAEDESGPPFRMSGLYYTILSDKSDPPASYQQPSGHNNLPLATVIIGPGDETQFQLYLGEFTPVSEDLRYRAQFEDLAGQLHFSAPFGLCDLDSIR